jgi:hypothetical protein
VSSDATPTSRELHASLERVASAIQDPPRSAKWNDKIGAISFVEQAALSRTIVEGNNPAEEFRECGSSGRLTGS